MRRGLRFVGEFLACLLLYGALIAWIVEMRPPVDVAVAILVAVTALVVSIPLQIVVHEGGHAVAALLLGVRIEGIRLFGRWVFREPAIAHQAKNCVAADVITPKRWLPARLVLFILAGPLANLAVAAVAANLASATDRTWVTRAIAAGVAMNGLMLGLRNLVPARNGERSTDGAKVLLWTFAARRTSQALDASRIRLATVANSVDPRRTQLELAAADPRAAVAGRAVLQLVIAARAEVGGVAAVHRYYDDLVRVLRLPDVDRDLVRALAGNPGIVLAADLVRQRVTGSRQMDPGWLERTVSLLELGLERAPGQLVVLSALALARVAQDRDDEARRMLLDIPVDTAPPGDVGTAYAIRAMAEAGCGDIAQARRLLRAAPARSADAGVVRLSGIVVDATERHALGETRA